MLTTNRATGPDQTYAVATVPFQAARFVECLPEGDRARNLHGHSFAARVRAAPGTGWTPFPGAETDILRERLQSCIAPLDYALLNDLVEVPTDENLARWVRSRLDVPAVESIGIQSTRNQGVDLDDHAHAHVWRRFRFEAAHRLPNVRPGHKCGRMHGHGFEVILHANKNDGGFDTGVDFEYLGQCWGPLHAELDHVCLNNIPGLDNPTSELLASWIWERVKPELPQLSWVTVYETSTACCHYRSNDYRIWKEHEFEAAARLALAPVDDPRHRLHGHSYVARLHVSAPLDQVMGWTVDYGDVKEIFKPLYAQLDHHRLDELESLESADTGSLLVWIRNRLQHRLPQLDRLDLFETPGCGGVLCWSHGGPALPG